MVVDVVRGTSYYLAFENNPAGFDDIDLAMGNISGNPALGVPVPYVQYAQLCSCFPLAWMISTLFSTTFDS